MDPIANLLTALKNTYQNRNHTVEVPYSKQKAGVCRVLKDAGIILDFKKTGGGKLAMELKDVGAPSNFRRISKLGVRVYVKSKQIPRPKTDRGVVVISTSAGIMSGRAARQRGLGGELICEIN